jgi:hypothetical protein
MPTLIRLVVILLVLAGLVYGAMFALVMTVKPGDKEITIRIPARDLVPSPERAPLVQREIDTSRTADSPPPAEPAPATPAAPAADPAAADPALQEAGDAATEDDGSIVTLSPGIE